MQLRYDDEELDEVWSTKFMVHHEGAVYSSELISEAEGKYVYTLREAIKECEEQFGPKGWEVYNGWIGINKFNDEVG